jgi:hypothetical protein
MCVHLAYRTILENRNGANRDTQANRDTPRDGYREQNRVQGLP